MKEVVTRRRLLELARAQTDEVDILRCVNQEYRYLLDLHLTWPCFYREELDRLRQRTFPSFHQLQHGMDTEG